MGVLPNFYLSQAGQDRMMRYLVNRLTGNTMRQLKLLVGVVFGLILAAPLWSAEQKEHADERVQYLVNDLEDSELKRRFTACLKKPLKRTAFSISHRGAPKKYLDHTRESYQAGLDQGAGVMECDVTFTADKALVCQHDQCQLHKTSNILLTPLAKKCSVPPMFENGQLVNGAQIKCCTSDITLAEYKTLRARVETTVANASTIKDSIGKTLVWASEKDGYGPGGTLMSHKEAISMFKAAGVKMTPELKKPEVSMPFKGMTQQDYALKMIDEYIAAGVDPGDVFPQTFNWSDIDTWQKKRPAFARQAVALDGRYEHKEFSLKNPASWQPSMQALRESGVRYLAPPIWMLIEPGSETGAPKPTAYAKAASKAGLKLIAWSLERGADLSVGSNWYYKNFAGHRLKDGDVLRMLDVLANDVGVEGVFSDWPATTSFYATCNGL